MVASSRKGGLNARAQICDWPIQYFSQVRIVNATPNINLDRSDREPMSRSV